jgi:prepilin-type N-terminal cleavage/methylation domain-containing protein
MGFGMIKRSNQKGVTLFEMILTVAIIAIVAIGIIILIAKQTDNVKNLLTSAKMTKLIEASNDYVIDNFAEIQRDLDTAKSTNSASGTNQHQASSDINGDGVIDENDKITIAALKIDIADLKAQGYLRNSFIEKTPWKTDLQVGVSFVGKENVIQLAVFNTNSDDITTINKNDIVSGIKDGMGAIWYGADSIMNFCKKTVKADGTETSNNCIRGMYSNWELKDPAVVFKGVFTPTPLTTDVIPLAVTFIDGNKLDRKSLYKNPVASHPEVNFVDSDLNFVPDEIDDVDADGKPIVKKEQGIFFNAMKNRDLNADGIKDFSGSNLTYKQEFADRNNDGIEEPITKAVLSLNSSNGESPYFSAEGGIITELDKTAGTSCLFDAANIYSDFGLIARASDGKLLKCISNRDTNDVTAGTWKEFGDVNYLNNTDIELTKPTDNDTDFEFYDASLENASAVVIQIDKATVEHTHGTNSAVSFEIKDPISGLYRKLLDINIPASEPSDSYEFSGQGIFPIKEGKLTYKRVGDFTVSTPHNPSISPSGSTFTLTSINNTINVTKGANITLNVGIHCSLCAYPGAFIYQPASPSSICLGAGGQCTGITFTNISSSFNFSNTVWGFIPRVGRRSLGTIGANINVINNNPGGGGGAADGIGAKIIGYIE